MKRSISLVAGSLALLMTCTHPYTQGEQLYNAYCVNCHMEDGTGLVYLIPPLADADYLRISRSEVPCVILHGSEGGMTVNGHTYTEPMPGFSNLNETELSNIINFIYTSWGNDLPQTSPAEVKQAMEACPGK